MKATEAIWIAMVWAASEAAPISPISSAAALKIVTSKTSGRRSAGRAARAAEARPVGPPEAAEQVVAAEFPVEEDDEREPGEHQAARKRRRDAGAGEPSAGKPRLPKIRHQGEAR